MKILISGVKSGLGRHLHSVLGGTGWERQMPEDRAARLRQEGVDAIIHCAFNSSTSHQVNSATLYNYVSDNIFLTRTLAAIPHRKFIYISTTAVYPKGLPVLSERNDIVADQVEGIYGLTKFMSEAIVRAECPNHLILRSTGLLGRFSRKNSLIRILEDDPCTLSLDGPSRFNYILHTDVSKFISLAMDQDISGTLNLASRDNLALEEVARWVGRTVRFGSYHYDVGNVDNTAIAAVFPAFARSSEDVVKEFIQRKNSGFPGE